MNLPSLSQSSGARTFALIAAGLFLWFFVIFQALGNAFSGNTIFAFIILQVAYVFLVMKYVLDLEIHARRFLSVVLVFMVFDMFLSPALVGRDLNTELTFAQQMSSDVFVYNLLPSTMAENIKLVIVYVLAPTIMLFAALRLTGRRNLKQAFKETV